MAAAFVTIDADTSLYFNSLGFGSFSFKDQQESEML
jgi:hypothetical protein